MDSLPVREDGSISVGRHASIMGSRIRQVPLGHRPVRLFRTTHPFAVEPVSSFDWTANPPYIKLPSALGIVLATLLNLGSFPLFYLGRFFTLLMLRRWRISPFALPCWQERHDGCRASSMTLHLASSYSYDAGIMGLAFLLTGMCLRAVYGEGLMSRREKAGIVVVAVLLAPARWCTVIVLLVILIPRKRFSSAAASARFKVVAIGFALLSLLVFRAAGLLQMAGVASSSIAEGSRGDEYGTFYSLSGLVSDPLNTVLLFLRTFDVQGSFYLDTLVGGCLAVPSRSQAPLYITVALLFIVVLSAQRSEGDNVVIPGAHRVLLWRLALAGFGRDTFDADRVDVHQRKLLQGVQGRYFSRCFPWPRWRCEVNI
ncbi:MAG: DUF2142 domain-containing protein [Eggerthellaceae bacterium]